MSAQRPQSLFSNCAGATAVDAKCRRIAQSFEAFGNKLGVLKCRSLSYIVRTWCVLTWYCAGVVALFEVLEGPSREDLCVLLATDRPEDPVEFNRRHSVCVCVCVCVCAS